MIEDAGGSGQGGGGRVVVWLKLDGMCFSYPLTGTLLTGVLLDEGTAGVWYMSNKKQGTLLDTERSASL